MKLPFNLLALIITLIKAIFIAERNGGSGPEKENSVLASLSNIIPNGGSWLDYLKYFSIISGLIKVIIKYLNESIGKDWGKENDDAKK